MQPPDQPTNDDWKQPQPATPQAPFQPVAPELQQQTPLQPQVQVQQPQPIRQQPLQEVSEQPATVPVEGVAEPSLLTNSPTEVTTEQVDIDPRDDQVLIRWEAAEYIDHDRSKLWYLIFGIITVIITAVAILLIKSPTFAVLVPVMAVALFIYTRHSPDMIRYTLSRKGLHINDRLLPFEQFKSFGVVKGAAVNSILLVPRKRFQPGTTIFFNDEVGESLVDMLASRLPMKEVQPDLIDKLLARLHL